MLVVSPLSEDTDQEVRTESDDISNDVMLDVSRPSTRASRSSIATTMSPM